MRCGLVLKPAHQHRGDLESREGAFHRGFIKAGRLRGDRYDAIITETLPIGRFDLGFSA